MRHIVHHPNSPEVFDSNVITKQVINSNINIYSHIQVEFEQEKHVPGDPDIRAEIKEKRRKWVAKAASNQ